MFITNNHFVALAVKRKFGKVTKIFKILSPWFSAKFYFAFYVFIDSSNCYSHILSKIYLIFLKNVLDQAWRSFKIEFGPQRKYWKKSYQVRQNLALFCNLVALILDWYCVKGLMVAESMKQVGFEGAWSELGPRDNYFLKSWVLSPSATHEATRIYQVYY